MKILKISFVLILVTFWNQSNNTPGQYRQACAKSQFICQQIPTTMQAPWDNNVYPYPDGNIVAVEYPNGQVKYHFVPKNNCQPQAYCNQIPNNVFSNTPWEDNAMKSDLNVQQQIALKQLEIRMLETHLQGQHIRNLPPYQLMFHHDAATSTTDLRYFCPTLDNSQWFNQAFQQPNANMYFQNRNTENQSNNPNVNVNSCPAEQMLVDGFPREQMAAEEPAENKDKNAYKVIFNDIVSLFSNLSGKVNQEEQGLKQCKSTTNEIRQKVLLDHKKSTKEVNKETKKHIRSSQVGFSDECNCSDCCCRH